MKNVLAKNVLSLLLTSSVLIGGGIGVLADEKTDDDLEITEVKEEMASEEADNTSTSSEVPITKEYFPDEIFREVLKQDNIDKNGDGILSESEITNLKQLHVEFKEVYSLKGIEYLTNLCELCCQGTHITSLDLSANPGIKKAYDTGEKTPWGNGYSQYFIMNDSWAYPIRSLTINDDVVISFSSGLGWNMDSKGWWFKNADGSYPKDGLKNLGGFLFCFDKSGYMISNSWKQIDGEWYYFDKNGEAAAEWKLINGKWYYFGFIHTLYTGDYLTISLWTASVHKTEVFYVNDDGVMQTGWQFINGEWRYFNNSGVMQTGWVKVSGKWYYFEQGEKPKDATMYTGWKKVDDVWYYFKPSGAMAANEFCNGYWLNANGSWTYQYKASWRMTNGKWWFGDDSGWYAKNETVRINDKDYNFDASGYCTNP